MKKIERGVLGLQQIQRRLEDKQINFPTVPIIETDFMENLIHGMMVSKLAYTLAKELGYSEEICYDLGIAGMVHDIGKLKLNHYVNEKNKDIMRVDELRYVRTHSTIGYAILSEKGYSEFIRKAVLYHHENYDGTGYPSNLEGESIPYGARILRICDAFAALISNRPYRSAFDKETAMELMIEDIKYFDLKMFLSFQKVLQEEKLMKALDNMDLCD